MERKMKVVCTQRVYDVQVGNKSTIVRVNRPMTVEDTQKLLDIDNRLDEFFETYEIISQRLIKPLSEDIGRKISGEIEEVKEEPRIRDDPKIRIEEPTRDNESRVELANIPNQKQRLWMILHDLPSDREITQNDWVKYMESKRYNRQRIQNNSPPDFARLVKMGKLKRIKKGLYRIIDKDIYKDDGVFVEAMHKLKNGETIVLG